MAFPIRKNISMEVGPQNTLDIFIKRKLRNFGLRTANNGLTPQQKQEIQEGIQNLKNLIYIFIDELKSLTNSVGNQPKISIGHMDSFFNIWDLASEGLEDKYRDYLPSFGMDVENLDETLTLFEEIEKNNFEISNSNSNRPRYDLVSDYDLIQNLSSLMEVSIPEEEYSLDDPDKLTPPARPIKNVAEILISC
jgi:hypothetical protein